MVKNLVDGMCAVAVFNTDASNETEIKVGPDLLGDSAARTVYDVWRQRDVGSLKDGDTVRLSPNGVACFIVRE